ncbi:MAG TPA: thioredoxin domain-containing protein [Candidatus Paceibacterota bacterium]|jgi:thioredoxin 1|nr:thioredoxin domain-containing protein [Candidatus Paceibacterota bacterium]
MDFYDEEIEREVSQSKVPVLVEFFAKWCRPCEVMKPIVDEIGAELGGKAKVLVVNIEENSKLANKFTVLTLPTFLVYRDGRRTKRLTGVQDKRVLLDLLQESV